jgi:hypothetical protein
VFVYAKVQGNELNAKVTTFKPSTDAPLAHFFHFQTDASEMFGYICKGHFNNKNTIKIKNIGWGRGLFHFTYNTSKIN